MVHEIDVQKAQEIIQYQFRDRNLLFQALQAADRNELGEPYWHDGNRRLALLGAKVVDVVVLDIWIETENNRSRFYLKITRLNTYFV
jgi:hypothetical protein